MIKSNIFRTLLLAVGLAGTSLVMACPEKGPMEKAGESVDEAADEVGDKVEDIVE